jgi:hypothetical protein
MFGMCHAPAMTTLRAFDRRARDDIGEVMLHCRSDVCDISCMVVVAVKAAIHVYGITICRVGALHTDRETLIC